RCGGQAVTEPATPRGGAPRRTSRSRSSPPRWWACIVDRAPSTSQSTVDRMSLLAITLSLRVRIAMGQSSYEHEQPWNKLMRLPRLERVPADLLVNQFT